MVTVTYPKSERLVVCFNQINIGDFFLEDEILQLYMKTDIETAIPIISGGGRGLPKCFKEDDYCYQVDVEIKVSFKNG